MRQGRLQKAQQPAVRAASRSDCQDKRHRFLVLRYCKRHNNLMDKDERGHLHHAPLPRGRAGCLHQSYGCGLKEKRAKVIKKPAGVRLSPGSCRWPKRARVNKTPGASGDSRKRGPSPKRAQAKKKKPSAGSGHT
jgi:hypothetical protein